MSYPSPASHHSPGEPSPSPHNGVGTEGTTYTPAVARDGNLPQSAKAAGKQAVREAVFLNEMNPNDKNGYISRYLHIIMYPSMTEYVPNALKQVEDVVKQYAAFVSSVPLNTSGDIRLRFDSVADACTGQHILVSEGYSVDFITPRDYARAKFQDLASLDEFEGQITITVVTNRALNMEEATALEDLMRDILSSRFRSSQHGPAVREIARLPSRQPTVTQFRVEMDSLDAATRTVRALARVPLHGYMRNFEWSVRSIRPYTDPSNNNSSSSTPDRDQHGRLIGFRHQPLPVAPFRGSRHHDQHNRVRRERVADGSDIRTTVMLRNIPNKLDWMGLKQILDQHCFGYYDFMYLRIDFSTGCNVGYAFINFTSLDGIVAMMIGMENKPWKGFKSQKHAEISYATIQGKEALVQKFRNSSVMQETSHCRPRLIYTWADAGAAGNVCLAGTEMPFPHADNAAKLHRSIQSARQTGLFPPNGGNPNMDHRHRPGMYDNGNPRDRSALAVMNTPVPPGWMREWFNRHVQGQMQQMYAQQPGVIGQPPAIMQPRVSGALYNSQGMNVHRSAVTEPATPSRHGVPGSSVGSGHTTPTYRDHHRTVPGYRGITHPYN